MTPHEPSGIASTVQADGGPRGAARGSAVSRGARVLLYVCAAIVLGFATTWSFLAYLEPDRVLDFATFLQMCGIALAR